MLADHQMLEKSTIFHSVMVCTCAFDAVAVVDDTVEVVVVVVVVKEN